MRLSDSFMELMSYTAHLLQEFKMGEAEDYDTVRRRYDELYQRARDQGRAEECPEEDWREAWFAVCAWIDEALLCSNWQEKDKWESSQLQGIYFQTTKAGEEFFSHLSALAPEKKEVRELYLYCLALGFKGRFFSPEDEEELDGIRQRNLSLLSGDFAADDLPFHDLSETNGHLVLRRRPPLSGHEEMLFPQAYDAGSKGKKRRIWFRGLSFFHLIVMAASLFFLISFFVSLKNNLGHLIQDYLLKA